MKLQIDLSKVKSTTNGSEDAKLKTMTSKKESKIRMMQNSERGINTNERLHSLLQKRSTNIQSILRNLELTLSISKKQEDIMVDNMELFQAVQSPTSLQQILS